MRTARTRKLHAAGVGLALATVALLFAACGSGSASPGVASLGSTTTTAQPARRWRAPTQAPAVPAAAPPCVMVMNGRGNGADMLKFAQCMRSHGVVDFPDPSSNGTISFGGTVSQSPQYPAADEACRNLLPNGGVPTAAQQAQGIAQLLKFSVCMRAHGISDFPDPTSNGIRIPSRKPSERLGPEQPPVPVRREGLPAPRA